MIIIIAIIVIIIGVIIVVVAIVVDSIKYPLTINSPQWPGQTRDA